MGLDVGTKTIGVALSDPLGITAQGLTTLKRKKTWIDIDEVCRIADQYDVETIVVGLPRHLNNSLGPQAQRVLSFVDLLKTRTDCAVELQDERFSTVSAEQVLMESGVRRENRKSVIDKIAATYILQTYMDKKGATNGID